jgi:hypothetical protein
MVRQSIPLENDPLPIAGRRASVWTLEFRTPLGPPPRTWPARRTVGTPKRSAAPQSR